MKSFLKKTSLFIIPMLMLFLPAFVLLIGTKENYASIDNVIVNKNKYLIGYTYNENNYKYLKWKHIECQEKKDVMILGSSRVLQFRKEMFTASFYNAGYTISSISDFLPFLKSIEPDKYPKYLIIGLDHWMFNENWDDLSGRPLTEKILANSFSQSASLTTFKSVYVDLLKGKYDFTLLIDQNINDSIFRVGLNAIANETGFRNDGSFYYGKQIKKLLANDSTASDYNFNDTYSRIKKGDRRFEFGNDVNINSLKILDELLVFCKANQIEVIAIIPPFADKVNDKLAQSQKHKYIDKIYPEANSIFAKYNFELWNFTSLKTIDSNDSEVIDGFHGSEVVYLRMLRHMIENGSKLCSVTSIEKLNSDLIKRQNNYLVYTY